MSSEASINVGPRTQSDAYSFAEDQHSKRLLTPIRH